jgi:segregation and condensation protein B
MINQNGLIEAILFICGKEGCTAVNLRRYLNLETEKLQETIAEMNKKYKEDPNSPYVIHIYDNVYYMLTKPELKPVLDQLNITKLSKNPLSKTLLEVLAIIAYNPDCTSARIAEVRDTDSSGSVDRLIKLGLVKNDGRADTPGRPYKFNVTKNFYDLIGVRSFGALPKLDQSFEIDSETDFFDSNRGNGKQETNKAKDLLISDDGSIGTDSPLKVTIGNDIHPTKEIIESQGIKDNFTTSEKNSAQSNFIDPFTDSLENAIDEMISDEKKDKDDNSTDNTSSIFDDENKLD